MIGLSYMLLCSSVRVHLSWLFSERWPPTRQSKAEDQPPVPVRFTFMYRAAQMTIAHVACPRHAHRSGCGDLE